MDRQSSAPGASAISDGSGNLGASGAVSPWPVPWAVPSVPSIAPSSAGRRPRPPRNAPRVFAQVRTAEAVTAFGAGSMAYPTISVYPILGDPPRRGKWNRRHDDRSAADMSRSGNLAEWERRLAAQHREDERLTRERRRQEKEQDKVRQQEQHEAKQRTADEQAAAVQEQIKS